MVNSLRNAQQQAERISIVGVSIGSDTAILDTDPMSEISHQPESKALLIGDVKKRVRRSIRLQKPDATEKLSSSSPVKPKKTEEGIKTDRKKRSPKTVKSEVEEDVLVKPVLIQGVLGSYCRLM